MEAGAATAIATATAFASHPPQPPPPSATMPSTSTSTSRDSAVGNAGNAGNTNTGSVSSRSSPFAYQQKLLERSSSKASHVGGGGSNSGHGASSSTSSASSPTSPTGGLNHSASIRRYPLPAGHRHNASLGFLTPNGKRNGGGEHSGNSESASGSPLERFNSTASSQRGSPSLFGTPSVRANRGGMGGGGHDQQQPGSPTHSNASASGSAPGSPQKWSGSSAFPRPLSPTKGTYGGEFGAADTPRRPASPTKEGRAASAAPGSPTRDDSSWITSTTSPGGTGSFWASSASGNAHSAAAPAAVHLGGVGDLKRSSVGALKMIRNFTSAADGHSDGSPATTRMTVGKRASALRDDAVGADATPSRPGRIASEDQEGEIYIPGITTGAEDVAGLHGRIRLARQDGPGAGSIALGRGANDSGPSSGSSSSLPFALAGSSKWMDTQRHLLQAYEYLCHCGEAKQWMEACIAESLGAVVDMENEMRDGVFLAKVARHFEPQLVPRIFTHPKLQYRHTDNVNFFFRFVHHVGLPGFFHFELTDLYEKKNFPKVVYCIHALSHILARQGRSVKVNNLVGKLDFTDDQLQQTQRGLDAAGVAMPSFGGLGKALAKEMNEEPEPEPESEQDRIDRELNENAAAVTALQTACRRVVAQRAYAEARERERVRRAEEEAARERERVRLAEEEAARERERIRIAEEEAARERERIRIAEEEAARERERIRIAEEEAARERERIRIAEEEAARERERIRLAEEEAARERERLRLEQQERDRQAARARLATPLQAIARGLLVRKRFYSQISALDAHESPITAFQSHARGALARNTYQHLIFQLAEATEDVIKTQAAIRGVLAKRALLAKIRSLRSVDPQITAVQAHLRGALARRQHARMASALQRAEVTRAVGNLQGFARAALARRRHQEQKKQLFDAAPDVTNLQAQIRGILARQEYEWWRDHIRESEPVAIHLQSLVRGLLARRTYFSKLKHYHEHMDKVVKIQSLFRGKQQGEQYRSLTMGKNVPVATIKNFGHLLNDSDHDFEDEIEVERLRKLVVRSIRENQTLENDVSELDAKIALLVKNKISIEEVIKAKNERGLLRQREVAAATLARRNSVLVAAGDPFADQTLDRNARRKLELYQELFYSLQTRPEYLARLFARVGRLDMPDRARKQVEKIVLTLFGYAQKSREEFLLLKLFQRCVTEELTHVNSVQEFMRGNAQFIKLVVQYNRGAKERQYLRDSLSPLIHGMIEDEALDLETDPCAIYRGTINQEEMETGQQSSRPLDVDFQQALADPMARTIFIRHLQALRGTTEAFLSTITGSTRRMPFGIRYIGREVFRALQSKFPQESEDHLIKVVGHLVYYRYLNPAIIAPESFDVIDKVVGPVQRKNLAEVSKMLTQVSNGRLFSDDNPYLQPLNEYVSQATQRFTQWLYNVIDVPDAEMHFNADEFLDHTVQQRPVIYISPNEIYSMHLLVVQQLDALAPNHEDPLRATLKELGNPPVSSTQELTDARTTEITFELISRRTSLKDPEADTKALFVETKRLVLSLLKVQSGKTLMDVFLTPVSDQDEMTWEEIVSLEAAGDRQRLRGQRPPMPGDAPLSPHLEDVRKLSFAELKARTLENMLQLEQAGKVSRATGYQEMLNSIAIDIRQKHRKRIQRHNEKLSMGVTLENLADKRRYLEEQISSYHSYLDASMQTMHKSGAKKRFVIPFSQQYFHLRSLKQQGKLPKFGSYKYTAQKLHEKGILLSIDELGDRQFDQLTLTISSDEAGIFTIDAAFMGVKVASTDLRIADLLEQQLNRHSTKIELGDATATVNLNLFISEINRRFMS